MVTTKMLCEMNMTGLNSDWIDSPIVSLML